MRRVTLATLLALLLPAIAIAQYAAGGAGSLVAHTIDTNLTITTSGTAEEVLRTWTIPANSFPTQYVGFRLVATGVHAANANNAYLKIRLTNVAGATIAQALGNTSGAHVILQLDCYVANTTTMTCVGIASQHNTDASVIGFQLTGLTFTSAQDFVITGATSTAAGDMILKGMQAYFFRP